MTIDDRVLAGEYDPAREPYADDPDRTANRTTGEIPPRPGPPEPLPPMSTTRTVRPRRQGRILRSAEQPYDRPPVMEHGSTDPISILTALDDWCAWHDYLTEQYKAARTELRWADHDLAVKEAEARARAKTNTTKDRRTKDDLAADVVVWMDRNAREVVERQIVADSTLDAIWKDLRNAERQIERLRSHNSTANKTYDGPR